jgi:peptide-methionine (R)-S-oxide reductase
MADNSVPKSEEEWKKVLTPEQYQVLRMKGTEAPRSGEYLHEKRRVMYACSACGNLYFLPMPSSTPARVGPASTRPCRGR